MATNLKHFLVLLIGCTLLSAARADDAPLTFGTVAWLEQWADISGTLEIEAVLLTRSGTMQKFELQYEPEMEFTLPGDTDLTVIPRLRVDLKDSIAPGKPDQDEVGRFNQSLFIGEHTQIELREFFIEKEVGDTYLTIGKQQVVWGKADGLKVLDVVNPQDFQEFTLDDFDDSRIPLWTVNVEIPVKQSTLQLLWIPDQTYHVFPDAGASYELDPKNAPPVVIHDPDKPSSVLSDSDFGARFSGFNGGWDWSLNYLYHYDDIPVLYQTIGTTIEINPGYERTHLLGASFSNAFGDLTVRSEIGVSLDKYYSTTNPTDPFFVHEGDELSYVIGLDWFGFDQTLLSVQFFQDVVLSSIDGLRRDRNEERITALARRNFRNDTIVASTLWVHSLSEGDGYVRPKIEYAFQDDLTFWCGADVFYGQGDDLFGQFRSTDRLVLGVEWVH